jgi:hypothetical protein
MSRGVKVKKGDLLGRIFYLLGSVRMVKLTNNRSGSGFFTKELLLIYEPLLGKADKGAKG